jgi:transposase
MKQSYSKSELAALADVSYSTFYRYLNSRRKQLSKLGICSERNNQGCYYRLYEMTQFPF